MRSQKAKMLHELCGRPMVLWPVRAALDAGGRVVVVDSPSRPLEAVLPEGVGLAVQERADGTGGAVVSAIAHLDAASPEGLEDGAPVLVINGDVPLISAEAIGGLLEAHRQSAAAVTMATTILEDPSGYGRVVRDSSGAVERVVETKTPGDASPSELEIREVNTGIFAFAADALRRVLPQLTADNAQGELYLPQALELLSADGAAVAGHLIEDRRLLLGVNDRVSLARVRRIAQDAIHERHMVAGVTIVDPAATLIDVDVEIGPDTVIEPFSSIRGSTRIGSACTVRQSYLVDCVLEDGVSVGPFGYLRPGTVLRSAKADASSHVAGSGTAIRRATGAADRRSVAATVVEKGGPWMPMLESMML